MIIFGPTLILTGMILIMLNKDEFEDQQEIGGIVKCTSSPSKVATVQGKVKQ